MSLTEEPPENLQSALAALSSATSDYETLERPISKAAGSQIINALTEAFQQGLSAAPESAAKGYQITAEILDAWGDSVGAIEYYKSAIDCDPSSPVGARYAELCAEIRRQEKERHQHAMEAARRQRFETLLSEHRDFVIEKLSRLQCRCRPGEEPQNTRSLWQIYEHVKAEKLSPEIEVCVEGSGDWQPLDVMCERALM